MRREILCIILVTAFTASAATISNPSFETPNLGSGFQYDPSGATWAFLGSAGIAANGSGFGFFSAPNGTQVAFLQTTGTPGSSISQTITNVSVGDVISFYEAERPNYGINSFNVLYNGNVIGNFTPTSTSFQLVSVVIPSGSPTSGILQFQSTGAAGSDLDTAIDGLAVNVVPEPGTFALAIPAIAIFLLLRRVRNARRCSVR